MNKTKRQILDTALELFNKQGLSNVSLRDITEKLNISPGNLTYHFKQREEIVTALYYEFVDSANKNFDKISPDQINITLIFKLVQKITVSRIDYVFLMRDFISVSQQIPEIKNHYSKILKKRQAQILDLFKLFVSKGILKEEEFENQYKNFVERVFILGNYWISYIDLINLKLSKKITQKYAQINMEQLYPYLTSKGKNEWHHAIKSFS